MASHLMIALAIIALCASDAYSANVPEASDPNVQNISETSEIATPINLLQNPMEIIPESEVGFVKIPDLLAQPVEYVPSLPTLTPSIQTIDTIVESLPVNPVTNSANVPDSDVHNITEIDSIVTSINLLQNPIEIIPVSEVMPVKITDLPESPVEFVPTSFTTDATQTYPSIVESLPVTPDFKPAGIQSGRRGIMEIPIFLKQKE